MIRKAIVIVIALLTIIGLLAGCSGVKQADLDAASAAKAAAEAQVTSLQSQLTAVNTAKTKAEADLAVANTAITKAQTDLAVLQKALTDAQAKATGDLVAAKADLATAQANLSKSSADLTTAQQALSTLNTSVKTYSFYVEAATLWFDMWANWESWNQVKWDSWDVQLDAAVTNSKDSALQTLIDTMATTSGITHTNAEEAFTNLLIQRLTEKFPKTQG